MVGGTPRLGCPCDDQRARGTVSDNSLRLSSVEGMLSHSGITGLDVADAPALSGGFVCLFVCLFDLKVSLSQ